MYLFAIRVKHFRSFSDLWVFPNLHINVIVGPNNCGKTNLIEAIRLVLDPRVQVWRAETVSRFDFHNLDLQTPIELIVWLKPVEMAQDESMTHYAESDEVKLALFDKLSMWKVETTERRGHNGATEVHPIALEPVVADPMAENLPAHESLLAIRLEAHWDATREVADVDVSIVDQVGNSLGPLTSRHRELINFIVLPSDREPLRELSLSRSSFLSQVLDENEVTAALRGLLSVLERQKHPLVSLASVDSVLSSLGRLILPSLSPVGTDDAASFTLTFLNGELWRLRGVTAVATTTTDDTGVQKSLPIERQGRGVQNLILLSHVIGMLRAQGTGAMIAVEEPEQNLEPSLARAVFGELCSLWNTNHSVSQGQLFVTTHSPALVGELQGPDSLLIFAGATSPDVDQANTRSWSVITGRHLSQNTRKKLDQRRELYANALFARLVVIAEGYSEMGFLPVAFRYFCRGEPKENPYHLGLEIINAGGKQRAPEHASILRGYGKPCHLLLDYDGPDEAFERDAASRFGGKVDFVTCWPKVSPLDNVRGCDLEVVLAAFAPPNALFAAIRYAYEDAGHPLLKENWEAACRHVHDQDTVDHFPEIWGDADLSAVNLDSVGDEMTQRLFLYALLHGPHCCKTTKDMRLIANVLAMEDALPTIFDDLRRKILTSMLRPSEIDHANPFLASTD